MKLYSSSREWRWSGAASRRGGIGCSTSENPPPDSSPQIMNRTPIEPRSPAFPSCGPTTLTEPVIGMAASLSLNSMLTEAPQSIIAQQLVKRKAQIRAEGPRRAPAADSRPDRRGDHQAEPGGRPRPDDCLRHP